MFTTAKRFLSLLLLVHSIFVAGAVAQDSVKLVGSPVFTADRAKGDAKGQIFVRNNSGKDLPVSLSAVPNCTSKSCATQVALAMSDDQMAATAILNATLHNSTDAQPIWLFISSAWDAGDTQVDLLDDQTKIGSFIVRSSPFTVKLDGPTADQANLTLTNDVPSRIVLKNEDPAPHDLIWGLFANGHLVCNGAVLLSPNGLGVLQCLPQIPPSVGELIKQQILDGSLVLSDSATKTPLEIFPVKGAAYHFSDDYRSGIGYTVIFLLLLLGGLSSLFLSQTLPNRLDKVALKTQMLTLAKSTADLSTRIDSKLAALVRIERLGIRDLLESQSTIFPDYANVISDAKRRLAALSTRVDLLQQMDVLLGQLKKASTFGAAPSLIVDLTQQLDAASVVLSKTNPTDTDLQSAQNDIATASGILDTVAQPGADFGAALEQRVNDLKTAMLARIANTDTFKRIYSVLPGPWDMILAADGQHIPVTSYVAIDMAAEKVRLIREYCALVEGTRDKEMLGRLTAREKTLIGLLQLDNLEPLKAASLLVREMKDDIYPERLQNALMGDKSEVSIDMDPAVAYDRSLLNFCVCFHNAAVNVAAAREEWTCIWNFGDGLTGKGWEVAHFFDLSRLPTTSRKPPRFWDELFRLQKLQPGTVVVSVVFQDADGKLVVNPSTQQPLTVSRSVFIQVSQSSNSWERTWTEGLKLFAALMIAIFGLVAGARDQLAKLDIVPGLVAVFLIGFGADTVKNLLTSKPASPTTTTAPKS